MKIPPKVKAGQEVRAEDWNLMVDYLRSVTLRPGVGYRVRRGEEGTVLQVGAGGNPHQKKAKPWRISVSEEGGGTYKITVGKGGYTSAAWHEDVNGDGVFGLDTATEVGPFEFTGIAATSDWGLWASWQVADGAFITGSALGQGERIASNILWDGVVKDSTHRTGTALSGIIATTEQYGYALLGRVQLVSGVATITPECDTNLALPNYAHLYNLVRVSADANNDISSGTDGGAFYDAP